MEMILLWELIISNTVLYTYTVWLIILMIMKVYMYVNVSDM